MPILTIEDAESSFLKARAEFEEWKDNFEFQFYQPQVLDLLGTMVNTMPMQSRMIAPNETAIMERIYRMNRGG